MITSKDERDLIYENNYNCCSVFAIVCYCLLVHGSHFFVQSLQMSALKELTVLPSSAGEKTGV